MKLKKSKDKKGRPKFCEYKFESPGREFIEPHKTPDFCLEM